MSNGKQAKGKNKARDFRRFIEESFPVKEVGEASAKEKNIRHGHISTLHIWWARRPLAASRATAYAALTPAPKDAEEWQKKRDFIIQLSQWENSNNQSLLERARREILEANGGVPPKVLDPFSGGGSYPLEALRLGCESYANDYNPVAVLIEKATLEFPQKFGRPFEGIPEWAKPQKTGIKSESGKQKRKKNVEEQPALFDTTSSSEQRDFNPLLNAVRYWGGWVLEEVRKELAEYYPTDTNGSIPVGYIWARTIPCQNPACGQEIPLMRQYWLSNKSKKKVALFPKTTKKELNYKIVGDGYERWPEGFDPDQGTVAQAIVTCPICGSAIDGDTTRRLFQEGKSSQKMMVVVLNDPKKHGKYYRLATVSDMSVIDSSKNRLTSKSKYLETKWGIAPIPDEVIHTPNNLEYKPGGLRYIFTPIVLYGMTRWGLVFNERQKLTLISFSEKVRDAQEKMFADGINQEFVKAVSTYLAIAVDRIAIYQTMLGYWHNSRELINPGMGRQAITIAWDYAEGNIFGGNADWNSALEWIAKVIEHCTNTADLSKSSKSMVSQESAMQLSFPDEYFDAVFTDPPYYDYVPYADISDFFYVWLKRTVGHLYPELFLTPLTPKAQEAVAELSWLRSFGIGGSASDLRGIKTPEHFEAMLRDAFKQIYRVLKPNGISTIVYAHKSTEGWETVINALLDSGLIVTGAWPLSTEMQSRLRASESAVLASSIYIVARKMPRQATGFYNDVRTELNHHLEAKLHRLWEEGIGGGDFFIAAIGSAIEVFGKYEQVMDYEGNIVRADRLLEDVRSVATNYAVKQILHNGFAAEITPMARFYVLWRWNYGEALVPFDEANKLAHSCGLDLSLQFSKNGFIKKEKEFVRMLGPQGRKLDDLDDPRDMIDVMHKSLLLWEKGQRSEMVKALADRGFGKSEAFYRVAQAISETLPLDSKEKKLLDGFLAGRDRVQEEVERETTQGKMF